MGPSPETRELGLDNGFDAVGMGANMPVIYVAPICLVGHGVVTQLFGVPLRGGGQRDVVLATNASSQI
jgi:hypothetical protein